MLVAFDAKPLRSARQSNNKMDPGASETGFGSANNDGAKEPHVFDQIRRS